MLRGVKGFEYIQVDARGRRIGKIETAETTAPQPGTDLHLSIDLNVQIEAERFLENKNGAIILLDPSNGEIIAFIISIIFMFYKIIITYLPNISE